jgi:hypothetical protein
LRLDRINKQRYNLPQWTIEDYVTRRAAVMPKSGKKGKKARNKSRRATKSKSKAGKAKIKRRIWKHQGR